MVYVDIIIQLNPGLGFVNCALCIYMCMHVYIVLGYCACEANCPKGALLHHSTHYWVLVGSLYDLPFPILFPCQSDLVFFLQFKI